MRGTVRRIAHRSKEHECTEAPANYAFKRTAGTLHRVSCCSVGPRPLNASLGHSVEPFAMIENLASTLSLKGVLDGLKPFGWEHIDHWQQGVLPPITVVAFALIPVMLFRGSPALRGPHHYEFADQDIHAVGPGFDTRVQWSVLTRATTHKFGLMLFSGKLPMVSVPGRAMSPSDEEAIHALLKRKGLSS
jgi:hypothetical protein